MLLRRPVTVFCLAVFLVTEVLCVSSSSSGGKWLSVGHRVTQCRGPQGGTGEAHSSVCTAGCV